MLWLPPLPCRALKTCTHGLSQATPILFSHSNVKHQLDPVCNGQQLPQTLAANWQTAFIVPGLPLDPLSEFALNIFQHFLQNKVTHEVKVCPLSGDLSATVSAAARCPLQIRGVLSIRGAAIE